jgi:uncharacterized membrane protein YozB (DUF420 family)
MLFIGFRGYHGSGLPPDYRPKPRINERMDKMHERFDRMWSAFWVVWLGFLGVIVYVLLKWASTL